MPNSAISFNTSGLATATSPGLVGTGAQTFAGKKTLDGGALIKGDITGGTIPLSYVGERILGTTSAPGSQANGAWVNIGSIPLTKGIWLIYGSASFFLNGTISGPAYCQLGIGPTSASGTGLISNSWFGSPTVGGNYSGTTVVGYLSIPSDTTYYLNISTQYTSASGGGGVAGQSFYAVRIA